MKNTARVVLLGQSLELRPGWEPVALADAASLTPGPRSPILLLAGDDAIAGLDPGILPRPRHDTLRIILAPQACPYDAFATWVRRLRCIITSPKELPATADALVRRGIGVRQRFEPEEWCPVPLEKGSAAWAAVRLLPELENMHDNAAWAATLGWTRQILWQVCRDDLAATPTQVMFWHVKAQVAQARERGYHIEAISRDLGYSGAANLTHVFMRRKERIPRNGG